MREAKVIRFIDLGDQILEGQREFAWWDTISDTFMQFNGNEAWESWKDFKEDYLFHFPTTKQIVSGNTHEPGELGRFKRLFPKEWPPPFVSAEDRKKRYEKGICDDIIDDNVIPDPKKLMRMKKKLDEHLRKKDYP